MSDLHFLFLQGLPSPFFTRIAKQLSALGCRASGINLSVGDSLFWRGPESFNYRGRLSDWPAYIAQFLEEQKVTDMVLMGEQREYHKQAITAAQERGIRVTVTDFGYLRPDWITFERDGMTGNSTFPSDPDAILRLAANAPEAPLAVRYSDSFWTMAAADMLYHFTNIALFWLFPHYRRPYKHYSPILHYPCIGWRLLFTKANHQRAVARCATLFAEKTRYFVFPMQLENDFQIIAYSPFACFEDAIQLIIQSFAAHADSDTRLIIKLHPLEPAVKNWRKLIYQWANEQGISERIDYFDGGVLDDIIQGAEGMITVNSTAGIRALQLGCPVMTLGEAIYNVAGLTYQGQLDDYWQQAVPPDTMLLNAFINAIASTIQIRGVFFNEEGLEVAVSEAAKRLYQNKVGELHASLD